MILFFSGKIGKSEESVDLFKAITHNSRMDGRMELSRMDRLDGNGRIK